MKIEGVWGEKYKLETVEGVDKALTYLVETYEKDPRLSAEIDMLLDARLVLADEGGDSGVSGRS